MAWQLIFSNDLATLAGQFQQRIYNSPPEDVLAPETVVVQTQGMAVYLRQFLAAQSIAANLETPFLNRFIDRALEAVLPEEEARGFRASLKTGAPEVLAWRIHELLIQYGGKYPALHAFAPGDSALSEFRRHQLAAALASLFDRYQYQRGDWLLEWSRTAPAPGDWQHQLFCDLEKGGWRGRHLYFDRAFAMEKPASPQKLPARVSLFGVGALPQLAVKFLRKLADYIDVELFILNPSREYWGDLRDRDQRRRAGITDDTADDPANPLLADFGTQGREFLELLFDAFPPDGQHDHEFFKPPIEAGDSRLHVFQEEIFEVRNALCAPVKHAEEDRSVSIHNCHNRRREVEILHDQLLDAIGELKLFPRDIIVMMPDVNDYAALIQSCFDAGPLRGSYVISDRTLQGVSSVAAALQLILKLPIGRCTAPEIMAIFRTPAVCAKFGWGEEELLKMEDFIRRAAICWGEDGSTRAEFCQTDFSEFSWRDGLNRLMLGVATDDECAGCAPVTGLREEDFELLGTFTELAEELLSLRRRLSAERPPEEWRQLLGEIFDTFFEGGRDNSQELPLLRTAAAEFFDAAAAAGFTRPIPASILAGQLAEAGNLPLPNQPFLRGKITFCSMIPLRSIPAKLIAILGLNEGDFPRRPAEPSFSLFALRHPGDRNSAIEDRYLFLEALLAARERLLLFYTGQSEFGDAAPQAAMPLAELIDYLDRGHGLTEQKHRLQNFAPEYYDGRDTRFFSYSEVNCAAANRFYATQSATPPSPARGSAQTFTAEKTPECPEWSLEGAVNILKNPCANFLKRNGNFTVSEYDDGELQDTEPFALDWFGSSQIFRELLATAPEAWPEVHGSILRRRLVADTGEFERQFNELRTNLQKLKPERLVLLRDLRQTQVVFRCAAGTLSGSVSTTADGNAVLYPGDLSVSSTARLRLMLARDLYAAGCARESSGLLLCADNPAQPFELDQVSPEDAAKHLEAILRILAMAGERPLPFMPKSGFAFVQGTSIEEGWKKAKEKFVSPFSRYGDPGELAAPDFAVFYRSEDLEDEAFQHEFFRLSAIIYQASLTPELAEELQAAGILTPTEEMPS